jgi:glycosyltransferase involved in cell wall biosynthesis
MPSPTVAVVVPALNEAQNLPAVLPRIPCWVTEVILVDDGSSDDTSEVARGLLPGVVVIRHPAPRGKGAALLAGIAEASSDFIITLDADGSADPAEIERFVDALTGGAELAKGSRFMAGGGSTDISRRRRTGNSAFVLLVRVLFRARFTDLCHGYNGIRRDALPVLRLDASGFEFEALLNVRAVRAGLRIVEVPTVETPRLNGESRLRAVRDGLRVLRTILRERWAESGRSSAPSAAGRPS